jgi:hypothetical protein
MVHEFYFAVYLTTLAVSRRYNVRRDDMNYEFELKQSIRGSITAFGCRDSGKPQKPSVKIANVPEEIRNKYLPNTLLDGHL